MRKKIIATIVSSVCLLGYQASALARDLAEHRPAAYPNVRTYHGGHLYNQYGNQYDAYYNQHGAFDPYNGQYYPPNFQPAWH
jgi:hypothetical protein